MADLSTNFIGIKSPNPFWLASAPPTDKEYNVVRAFEAGWGGVVWKTLGEAGPPVVNVNGPRYGAIWGGPATARAQQHRADHRPPISRSTSPRSSGQA
jgi:dihydroorotate dehydrogenase